MIVYKKAIEKNKEIPNLFKGDIFISLFSINLLSYKVFDTRNLYISFHLLQI
jgi:hypothetical protein